jgi:hypothetical protein
VLYHSFGRPQGRRRPPAWLCDGAAAAAAAEDEEEEEEDADDDEDNNEEADMDVTAAGGSASWRTWEAPLRVVSVLISKKTTVLPLVRTSRAGFIPGAGLGIRNTMRRMGRL